MSIRLPQVSPLQVRLILLSLASNILSRLKSSQNSRLKVNLYSQRKALSKEKRKKKDRQLSRSSHNSRLQVNLFNHWQPLAKYKKKKKKSYRPRRRCLNKSIKRMQGGKCRKFKQLKFKEERNADISEIAKSTIAIMSMRLLQSCHKRQRSL
jgi:hypothetical protein